MRRKGSDGGSGTRMPVAGMLGEGEAATKGTGRISAPLGHCRLLVEETVARARMTTDAGALGGTRSVALAMPLAGGDQRRRQGLSEVGEARCHGEATTQKKARLVAEVAGRRVDETRGGGGVPAVGRRRCPAAGGRHE